MNADKNGLPAAAGKGTLNSKNISNLLIILECRHTGKQRQVIHHLAGGTDRFRHRHTMGNAEQIIFGTVPGAI